MIQSSVNYEISCGYNRNLLKLYTTLTGALISDRKRWSIYHVLIKKRNTCG